MNESSQRHRLALEPVDRLAVEQARRTADEARLAAEAIEAGAELRRTAGARERAAVAQQIAEERARRADRYITSVGEFWISRDPQVLARDLTALGDIEVAALGVHVERLLELDMPEATMIERALKAELADRDLAQFR